MPSEAWGLSSEHYLLGSQESSRDCTIGSCSMPMKPMTTEPGKLARLPILGIPRGPPPQGAKRHPVIFLLCGAQDSPVQFARSIELCRPSCWPQAAPRQVPNRPDPKLTLEVPTEGSQCGTCICILWLLLGRGGE